MSTRTKSPSTPAKTLELSLPLPAGAKRIEALDFLNGVVERYLEEYGDDIYGGSDVIVSDNKPDIHFPSTKRRESIDDDFIPDRPAGAKRFISVTQAIQLSLCALLIFFLW